MTQTPLEVPVAHTRVIAVELGVRLGTQRAWLMDECGVRGKNRVRSLGPSASKTKDAIYGAEEDREGSSEETRRLILDTWGLGW